MAAPSLDRAQVHVYTASLEFAPGSAPDLWGDLSADERARADRYATPQLRQRFVAARGILRRLLSRYRPIDAPGIAFGYGARGKPYLAGSEALTFNVSHTDGMAIFAIASGRDVGIDIEATGRDVEIEGIARKVLSPLECEALDALSPSARRDAFFRIWTRKEAYIKALGAGFGYPTASFTVSHCDDGDALIADDGDRDAPRRWRVIALDARPGYAAALAARGRDWSVRCFEVPVTF